MANKKYQVFVSSTYNDLIEERKSITQTLLECDCIPTGMELFPASNRSQWDLIKKVINESDYYLLVIAGRYGSIGTDDNGNKVGYTEMEYDYAKSIGKPIVVFLHKNRGTLPSEKTEKKYKKRLEDFIRKVSDNREVRYWDNSADFGLQKLIIQSMAHLKQTEPAPGWIRGEDVNTIDLPPEYNQYLLTGKWILTHKDGGVEYKDCLDLLHHNPITGEISGQIARQVPNDVSRDWQFTGFKLGENFVSIYFSHKDDSIGCSLLRHIRGQIYGGKYLRYNFGTKEIDEIDGVRMKKEESK